MSERKDRRSFLKAGVAGVGGLSALGVPALARQPEIAGGLAAGRAKNLILLIGDGMGLGAVTLGDMYSRLTRGKRLAWMELMNDPRVRTGLCDTSSADGLVSDSSATASAWSTGEKINNSAVNMMPDGRELEPLWGRAQRAGKVTGVVTTSRLTDATPACMYANAPKRSMEREIGEQMLARGTSVMLGGGGSVLAEVGAAGAMPVWVKDLQGLNDFTSCGTIDPTRERMLGTFGEAEMPFVMDRGETTPSLVRMAQAGLRWLGMHEAGFMLQIEAGRIDHAAHSNDAAAMVREMVEFDDVIGLCAEYAFNRGDTLVVITADHANANPGLTLYGKEGDAAFARLASVKHSFEWMFAEYGRRLKAGAAEGGGTFGAIVTECTGLTLSEQHIEAIIGAAEGRRDLDPFRPRNSVASVLGSVLANHYGVAFVSPNHASDFVLASAMGPGSEGLKGFGQNTDLFGLMVGALGLG